MIDVVIPLFNKQETIIRCLTSVVGQTCLPSKLIIVDDGSTDLSAFKAEQFLKNYDGRYEIITTINRGVSAARNLGVRLAKSPFVAFLDADDYWDETFLECSIAILHDSEAEGIGLLSFFHRVKKGQKFYVPNQGAHKNYSGIVKRYSRLAKRGSPVNSSKVVIRKDVLESIGGFPEGNGLTEDLYVWLKVSLISKVYLSSKVLVTVDKSADPSRPSRLDMKPYILMYYLESDAQFSALGNAEISYLRHVYFIQSLYAIRYGTFGQSKNRIHVGKKRFPMVSKLLFALALFRYKVKINV